MQIHGPTHIHGPHGINPPHTAHRASGSQPAARSGSVDRVDISPAAEAAVEAAEGAPIRRELVDLIRREIAAGSYDTPEKMDIAMERLLDEMG
jgi:negative regulator of flagellin synthesis FlgM